MSGNSFGSIFRITSFGESHGPALGGIIEGCPSGVVIDEKFIQSELDARRPGARSDNTGDAENLAVTSRKESDNLKILSGVFEGKSTGTPIGFYVENQDNRSSDYSELEHTYRPGHADYTMSAKYGMRDHRGGGRSSARETVSRVAGGAVAQCFLRQSGISLHARTIELGGIAASVSSISPSPSASAKDFFDTAQTLPFFAPNKEIVPVWEKLVAQVKSDGDSIGGVVQLCTFGLPAGLGEPVFDKLDARLAAAMLSVGAVKGVEFGAGFSAAKSRGSINNDIMIPSTTEAQAEFSSNNAGGILGGMSTGQPLLINVAIKPIPSIAMAQNSITDEGIATQLKIKGRHDVSAIPRVVPVLKAMLAMALADFLLLQRCAKL